METYQPSESEYRFACIVWAMEPLPSGQLVSLCNQELGWKKSTTYTVLKKLCDKQILQNIGSIVTSCVPKEQVQKQAGQEFLQKNFAGSLPGFIASFMDGKKLTATQADEIKKLIDNYREE